MKVLNELNTAIQDFPLCEFRYFELGAPEVEKLGRLMSYFPAIMPIFSLVVADRVNFMGINETWDKKIRRKHQI